MGQQKTEAAGKRRCVVRREEKSQAGEVFTPHASRLTSYSPGRLRWRCRRGMLELDLVLERFLGENYVKLTEQQQAEFDALLDLPDQDLWALIRSDGTDASAVVQWLRACQG
jgi:antitoxin CptB